MINLIGSVLLLILTCFCGLVAYGKYYECDILGAGIINKGEKV